jgi:hypothetical protein
VSQDVPISKHRTMVLHSNLKIKIFTLIALHSTTNTCIIKQKLRTSKCSDLSVITSDIIFLIVFNFHTQVRSLEFLLVHIILNSFLVSYPNNHMTGSHETLT